MEANGGNPIDSGNPLLRAVFLRRLRLTRLLLEGGAYINESDSHGRTPLIVACRTQHVDAQSASRVKLVKFLLEKGADPNLQDKDGRSAVMHACREQTGADVVSLLLANGADISLQDKTNTSALVYAVMAGDLLVLKLLLDTCKAKGKEVIIISTEQSPCGKVKAEQFLTVPSLPTFSPLVQVDKLMPPSPASPSDVQLITSSSSLFSPKPMFSFKEEQICGIRSYPASPSRLRGLGQTSTKQNGLLQPLLRLNSEPWLKIPNSLFASDKTKDLNQEENSFLCPLEQEEARWSDEITTQDTVSAKQKLSLPGLISSRSASSLNRHSSTPPHLHEVSSSLHSIIQRRKLGSDIYSSDPLLATNVHRGKESTNGRKLSPLRGSGMLGFEHRGSDAFLLDSSSQFRPRSLPPLTFTSMTNSGIGKEFVPKNFLPSAPPGQPKEATRRTLLRRHSMQSERLKTTT